MHTRNLKYGILKLPINVRKPYYSPPLLTEESTLKFISKTNSLTLQTVRLLDRMAPDSSFVDSTPKPPLVLKELRIIPKSVEITNIPELVHHDYGFTTTKEIAKFLYKQLSSPSLGTKLTSKDYNSIIGFFLKVNDIQMVNHTLNAMLSHKLQPETNTMNMVLDFYGKRIIKSVHCFGYGVNPLIIVNNVLSNFSYCGYKADAETWVHTLQCMPLSRAKYLFLKEMKKRGIIHNESVIDPEVQSSIVQSLVEENKNESYPDISKYNDITHVMQSMNLERPLTIMFIRWLLFTHREHLRLKIALKIGLSDTYRSTEMLNIFLQRLSRRFRLDYQLAVLDLFQCKLDSKSYEYLLESALNAKSNKMVDMTRRYTTIGTLYKQMQRESIALTSRGRKLVKRAIREAKRDNASFRDIGNAGWEKLKDALKWSITDRSVLKHKDNRFLKVIGFSDQGEEIPSTKVTIDPDEFNYSIELQESDSSRSEKSAMLRLVKTVN
ncbi:hypothetical protein DASB73_025710 [Starmerella bacillaris]|uniref:Uncharacterized protein n=1 Tax=Starmerella bacillaris TaxID=1247836 RepID=A0AAV5RKD1_STABA|nr:hypothetical protein DASB73_025710 [Starmerella bacillaris]